MARSQIPITDIARAGIAPPSQVTADATNKHYVDSQAGDVFLEIISTDGSSQSVVVEANPALSNDGLTVSNLTLTIPAGATRLCGPFRKTSFRQSADLDRMYVNPSVSTTLQFRAYRLVAT